MPRWVRIWLTASAFLMFFAASVTIGIVAALLMRLLPRGGDPRGFTRKVNANLRSFCSFMRDTGLIDFWPPRLPAAYEDRAFLLIANHPTLIDTVLLMASFPQITVVVKSAWYRSFLLAPLVRRTVYVPGPGLDDDEDEELPVVSRIEATLRAGTPVLVFPEGTRSKRDRLNRFRRGALEAAIRAEVPILPMFIGTTTPFLMKGQPWYDVPDQTCDYFFEWFPPLDPRDFKDDPRGLRRRLEGAYRARFEKLLEDRSHGRALPAVAQTPPDS